MTDTIVDDTPTTINGLTLRPSVRKRWVEALRSGEYTQGAGQLRDDHDDGSASHCCLGVLCDIAKGELGLTWTEDLAALVRTPGERVGLGRQRLRTAGRVRMEGELQRTRWQAALRDQRHRQTHLRPDRRHHRGQGVVPAWAGDNITYGGMHNRIRRVRGSASNYACEFCGEQARDWSYDKLDPNQKSVIYRGLAVTFSTNMDHYRPLCKSCHNEADDARGKSTRTVCRRGHPYEGNRTSDKHCRVCKNEQRKVA